MLGKLKEKIGRQNLIDESEGEPATKEGQAVSDTKEGSDTGVLFEREGFKRTGTEISSISIPEFTVGEPYPYFYHTWNKLLLCNLNDVVEAFHINNSDESSPNIYVFNNDLTDDISNFETQHNEYGNSLQNYYTIVNQTTKSIDPNWKEKERINKFLIFYLDE